MQKILNKNAMPTGVKTQEAIGINQKQTWLVKLSPWMGGAGIAVGHVLTSSNCSIPKQGSCSACGSCVVALGSLTAWAVIKQRSSDQPFYEQTTK